MATVVTVLRSRSLKVSAILLSVPLLVLLLVVLGVLPVRAYASQRRDIRSSTDRLEMLTQKNAELRERVRLLQTDDEIKRIARSQYAMVAPGEKLRVIPGLGDGSRSLSTPTDGAAADRVPTEPTANTDSSVWAMLRDLVRFVRPT